MVGGHQKMYQYSWHWQAETTSSVCGWTFKSRNPVTLRVYSLAQQTQGDQYTARACWTPKLQFIWLVWYACHAQAQVDKPWSSWTRVWDAYNLIAICSPTWNVNTSSVTAASAKLCESAFQESVCMWSKENMHKRNGGAETNGCILGPGSLRAVWVQVRGGVGIIVLRHSMRQLCLV